jgi:multidrug efflux pump subunit AcrA (membrane-fusion protein)
VTRELNKVYSLFFVVGLFGVDGRRFVWTVVDGKAARRWVETGTLAGNNVSITSGLSEGDQVITVGNHKVSEGMEVNVK